MYNNRGNAFYAIGTPEALKEAVASYDGAIRTLENLDLLIWKEVKMKSIAFYNKTLVCLYFKTAEYLEMANDAAEEGLGLLRNMEMKGIYVLRSLREEFFEVALDTYLAGSYHFLPELILEHLDPANLGAAPESWNMHKAALKGLQRAFEKAFENKTLELIEEISVTHLRLIEIRSRFFAGTALGARLRSEYWERAGDLKNAEDALTAYTRLRPSDPEGQQLLGAFYARRGQRVAAIKAYERAAMTLAIHVPEQMEEGLIRERLQIIFDLINLSADLKFGPWPEHGGKQERNQVLDQGKAVDLWLEKFLREPARSLCPPGW